MRVESGRSHSGDGTKVAAELFSRREWQIVDTEAVVQRQPVYEDAPHQTLEVASILSFRAVGITPQFDTQLGHGDLSAVVTEWKLGSERKALQAGQDHHKCSFVSSASQSQWGQFFLHFLCCFYPPRMTWEGWERGSGPVYERKRRNKQKAWKYFTAVINAKFHGR